MEQTELDQAVELTALVLRHTAVSMALRDFMEIMWPSMTSEQRHETNKLRERVVKELADADNLKSALQEVTGD